MKLLGIILSAVSAVFITASLFLWFAAGEIYDYEDNFDLKLDGPTTEVVVVLAGGKRRIPQAVELWKRVSELRLGKAEAPVLFLSGVGPNANLETLHEQGVPKETLALLTKDKIIFENVSENTFENAQLFASFVRQKKWKKAVLVTAGYHMRRADFVLRRILGNELEWKRETVDAIHFDRNEWHGDAYAIRVTLIEYIKWLYYRYSY